jgi:hypothetical protein
MKTATIQPSVQSPSVPDSSSRPSMEERIRRLDEATLNALRNAGAARAKQEREEQEALALRESQATYRTETQ